MKASPMQKCEKMKGNEGGRFSNHYPITGWVIGRWSLFLLSAIFCITMYNSLITNFVTKKRLDCAKYIQGAVLRERKQREKRYCSHYGTSDN